MFIARCGRFCAMQAVEFDVASSEDLVVDVNEWFPMSFSFTWWRRWLQANLWPSVLRDVLTWYRLSMDCSRSATTFASSTSTASLWTTTKLRNTALQIRQFDNRSTSLAQGSPSGRVEVADQVQAPDVKVHR